MFKFFKRSSANSHVDNKIDYKVYQQMRHKISEILFDKIHEISEKEFFYINPNINLQKTKIPQLPYQIGDEVILNVYDLLYNSTNGWDCGAHGISYMDKSKLESPAIVKVTGIGIDYSLAQECIDRWIDRVEMSYTELLALSPEELFQKYSNRRSDDKESAYKNKYGVFLYVKWEVTQDQFGDLVNKTFTDSRWITSFLKFDSDEGKITYEMWKKEIKLKKEIKKLRLKKEKLEKEWEEIYVNLGNKKISGWRIENYML